MSKEQSPWDGTDGPPAERADRAPAPDAPAAGAANPWLIADADARLPGPAAMHGTFKRPRRPALLGRIAAGAWLPWLLCGLTATALLATSIHLLPPGKRGLVSTLGRQTRALGPGLSVTLPWPVETVRTFDVGAFQTAALPTPEGENLMLTRDGQIIDVAFQVRWKIVDLPAFAGALKAPESAIRDLADAEMRGAIAEEPFDSVWDGTTRHTAANRAAMRMQAVLNAWRAGVAIDGIEITRANPPGQLSEAFLKVTNARTEARDHRQKAEEWGARTLNNARAEAQDFERIYLQYQAAPEITRRRMYYETMERVIANNARVIVGGTAAQIVLPEAKAQPAQAQPQAQAPAPAQAQAGKAP